MTQNPAPCLDVAVPHETAVQERKPRLRLVDRAPLVRDTDLAPKHRLVVEYMVHGVEHTTLARRVERDFPICDPETGMKIGNERRPVPLGEPLTLAEAATVIGMKQRTARLLASQPAFQRLLARETEAFRNGAKARAWRNVDAIAHNPGAGKAADRKVQLAASLSVIGEPSGGPSVSVTVNNSTTHIAPGIVVRLPAGVRRTPLELEASKADRDAG